MDYSAFQIAGVSIIALAIGLTQAAKKLGLRGNGAFAFALLTATLTAALYQAIALDLIPSPILPWISVLVFGLGGGLAATGLYDLSQGRPNN
jgi:hypothetical protein